MWERKPYLRVIEQHEGLTDVPSTKKPLSNIRAVEECISGEAGGFDYKHDIFLKPGWEFHGWAQC